MASVYPGALPTYTNKTNKVDLVDAAHINSAQDDIVALATEIGTDPAGSCTDLKTRLAIILGANGAINLADEIPGTGIEGKLLFVTHVPYYYNGTEWKTFESTRYQLFTANGTFTVPTGVTMVRVTTQGGGASGATGSNWQNCGGGGGAGAVIVRSEYIVIPLSGYPVVVGAGGAAVSTANTPGNAGAVSTFDGVLSANAGTAGHQAAVAEGGVAATVVVGDATDAAVGARQLRISYAGGAGFGKAASNPAEGGGGSYFAPGGAGGTNGDATKNGTAGTYGSGGGGAAYAADSVTSGTSGAGGSGFVLIEW